MIVDKQAQLAVITTMRVTTEPDDTMNAVDADLEAQ